MSRRALIAITILALLALVGFGTWFFFFRTDTKIKESAQVDETGVSETKTLSDHSQFYDIDARYPREAPFPEIQKTLEDFVLSQARSFKKENIDTLTSEDVRVMQLGGDRKYALSMDYETYTSSHTVSYVFTLFLNTMGAHPNTTYRTFTFDRTSGQELTLGNLFKTGTPYLEILSTKARTQLLPMIASASNSDVADVDTEYLKSGTEPRAENFAWFYLQGSTLVLIFPPYQVGPYVLGTQSVPLPVSSLLDFKSEYK